MKTKKIRIDQFELLPTDSKQISGYAQGLRQEYLEAKVSLFVIYCFGNQGYRVFVL